MEIREFAERILFGGAFDDKLVKPDKLTDRRRGKQVKVPSEPGRPDALSFPRGQKHARVPFPGVHELDQPKVRGHVLHFFANHELLAMELMALILLRFPEAPESFRRGIVDTIIEEQKHMELYRDRMQVTGVEFGEIPVNEYFWNCLKDVDSPLEFVTGMSMTLEQANLDYSGYYRKAFRAIEDHDTADVLDIVYREEIGHVKHGVVWFDRWRPPGSDRFESWMENLPQRLPPVRAKGLGYDEESRRKAGLDDAYIRRLRVLGGSKGRPPNIYWFTPAVEEELSSSETYEPSKLVRGIQQDLETLPMFLCASDDVVITRHKPDSGFLTQLAQIGYEIPEFAHGDSPRGAVKSLSYDRIGEFIPWGWTPTAREVSAGIQASRVVSDPEVSEEETTKRHTKSHWTELRVDFLEQQDDPRLANPNARLHTMTGVEHSLSSLGKLADKGLCYRGDFGTAGRGIRRWLPDQRSEKTAEQFVRQLAGTSGIIEPLYNRKVDFSWQLEIMRDGEVRHHGILRTIVDRRGQFRGAVLKRFACGLSTDILRFVYDDGKDSRWMRRLMHQLGERVGGELRDIGYRGVIGIDGFIHQRSDGSYEMEPLCEVNPRMTMGRIAMKVGEGLSSSSTAVWLLMHKGRLIKQASTPLDFCQKVAQMAPRSFTNSPGQGSILERGAFFTTDPQKSESFWSLCIVGTDDEDALDLVEAIDPEAAACICGKGLGWGD